MKRYFVPNTSIFDHIEYNVTDIKKIVRMYGAKNIRTRKRYDMSNQPSVVTFDTDKPKEIQNALNFLYQTEWIHVWEIS